jgi:anti-sigma28 factor (negative regulator of flagellin synthesis)
MKIYDQNPSGAAAAGTNRTQDVQQSDRSKGTQSSRSASEGGDRVEFSGSLGRLSKVLSTDQADRAGRVQALTAQYQSGTYRADSAATSRGMVGEALGSGLQ